MCYTYKQIMDKHALGTTLSISLIKQMEESYAIRQTEQNIGVD